jgi:hypothetical protein
MQYLFALSLALMALTGCVVTVPEPATTTTYVTPAPPTTYVAPAPSLTYLVPSTEVASP